MAIVTQGSFTSTGVSTYIPIPSGIDSFKVWNYTTLAAGGAGTGVMYEWRKGYADRYALEYTKLAADESITAAIITTNGFTVYDSTSDPVGPLLATITTFDAGGVAPLVNAAAHGLVTGDVVRLINILGGQQLGGIDYTVERNAAGSFYLVNMPTIVATTTGSWRKIKWDPIFYPRERVITEVAETAAGGQALVTLSVTHGYTVGQVVSFRVPSAFGMVELDGLTGTITAIGTGAFTGSVNTITVDIDPAAFTAFAFPLTAADIFTPAQVIPVGKDASGTYVTANGSTYNEGELGMMLEGGTGGPAGIATNVIYWEATKSNNL